MDLSSIYKVFYFY